MKRLLLNLFICFAASTAWAQGPNESGTYYRNADGKKGAALKTAMCGIIRTMKDRGSKSTVYGYLWEDFKTTDKRPDGKVWDMYSNITNYTFGVDQAGNFSKEGDKYNREHSFPKSWFNEGTPMYYDLFHLYPTDGYVNNTRGNDPFGETNGSTKKNSANNFSKYGACTYPGYTGNVFEPNDIYKGDFARTYFYMVTCYENEIPSWSATHTLDGNKYPGLADWQLKMLMEWSKKDPVSSDKEIPRNTAVYGIQNNRNPFIDYPGLEEYIWGSYTDVAFSYDNYQTPTNIIQISVPDSKVIRVHSINGILIRSANDYNEAIQGLPKGIYIINGKKIVVK